MERQILQKCFNSSSDLWQSFLKEDTKLNVLYYPSAGEDLRPFLFSKTNCLKYIGVDTEAINYFEPNLFIFSDYFPYPNSSFFDTQNLHCDNYTQITVENFCEIRPTPEFIYHFNKVYVDFEPSKATGKAIFFKAKIWTHIMSEPFYKYAIYFFYENVNLIDQLFLKHKLPISHIVWKRDGSGLGGGRVYHNFLYPVSELLNTKFYFIWRHYLDSDNPEINYGNVNRNSFPSNVSQYLPNEFTIKLNKKRTLRWDIGDSVNLYDRE